MKDIKENEVMAETEEKEVKKARTRKTAKSKKEAE